jgi:insulinase (Peptidase family M16)/peptidase M16-like protein
MFLGLGLPRARFRGVREAGFVLAVVAGFVGVARPAAARSPNCEQAERLTLKNGTEVVLVADAQLPAVAVLSSIHVGSRNDPPEYQGLAHYVEHLTFRDAAPFAPVFELYGQVGATKVNATTSPDTTNYYAVVPAAQLERALWIEARRLAVGLDALTDPPALEERQVVLREHALRFGNGTNLEAFGAVFDGLFPAGHPYRGMRATTDSIGALSLADARWFFARYYRPDRLRLVLVGDFQAAQAKELIEKHFGGLVARELGASGSSSANAIEDQCRWAEQMPLAAHARVVVTTLSRIEQLEFYWPVPSDEEPERWRGILTVLAREVGDSVRQLGLGRGVDIRLQRGELGNFWLLSVSMVPGQPFENAEPLVRQLFAEVRGSVPGAPQLGAEQQALELQTALADRDLISRAQNLAERECKPSRCVEPSQRLTQEAFTKLDRFDLKNALVVERRYSRAASLDGDVEVRP